MKNKLFTTFLISMALFFSACKKDSNEFIPDPGQQLDSAWVGSITPLLQVSLLSEKLRGAFNTATVDAVAPAAVILNNSLQISMPPSGFSFSGSVITGALKIDYTLVQRKGDFIRYSIPTVSNRFPIESGGALNVKVSLNNQPVDLIANKKIKIQYVDAAPKQGMKLYYGDLSFTGNLGFMNWLISPDSLNVPIWDTLNIFPQMKGYTVETPKTGWLHTGKLLDLAQPRTEVSVVLPDLFSNANTAVYMVFKNVRCVVQLTGNQAQRRFSFPNIPINQDVVFVAISKVGDTYYLGLKEDKTVQSMVSLVKPERSSLSSILTFLNNLQ
jgi:hypothetical protein